MLKSCVLVLLVVGLSLGLRVTSPPDRPTPAQVTLDLPLPAPSPPAPIAPRRWTVAAVGDVLLHGALQRQAATSGFQGLWREVEPQFHRATVVYANLEGPTAPGVVGLGKPAEDPGAVFDNRVYTSYPMFNYPPALLDALQSSGVGVVSTANNHSLDRGILGVRRTIAELDTRNLAFTGTREDSESSRAWYVITNTDGLTVAWLACTYGTNGIPDRQGQVLDCYKNREQLLDLVRDLSKDEGLGAIIVTPHWGVEYASTPSQREKSLARELIDAGATAVLGSHPHVPQPLEIHATPDGREGLIAYSLGNFVSGQFHRLHTRAAVLVRIHLEGQQGERATLKGVEVVHMEMTRLGGRLQVHPLPFPGHTPALSKHLEEMFGPSGQRIALNP